MDLVRFALARISSVISSADRRIFVALPQYCHIKTFSKRVVRSFCPKVHLGTFSIKAYSFDVYSGRRSLTSCGPDVY